MRTDLFPYFFSTYLLSPPEVPPVPNVQTTSNSSSEWPIVDSCWSISGAVTVSCALTFISLSYCSGQKPPYILARSFARFITSCRARSSSTSRREPSRTVGSRPNWLSWFLIFAETALTVRASRSTFIPGAGQMSTSRLTAFTLLPCSSSKTPSCNFLETSTITSRPRSAKSPSEIPKFPEVASKTGCPLLSLPPLIASSTICTIGLTFTDPLRILDSSFPNTLNSFSGRSSPYTALAHSFSKSVKSTRGVALSTLPPLPRFSTWGTFAPIDSSKLRRRAKSTRLECSGAFKSSSPSLSLDQGTYAFI